MRSIFYLLAGVAGALVPLQALINAHLGRAIGGPFWASATQFAIGTVALIAYSWSFSATGPLINQAVSTLPWWAWIGGIFGAFFIASTIVIVPKIGATAMLATIIMGQLVSAVLLDHYGVLHAAQPVSFSRIMGVCFLMVGVLLITRTPS
jgi:transporter family-2 protein